MHPGFWNVGKKKSSGKGDNDKEAAVYLEPVLATFPKSGTKALI